MVWFVGKHGIYPIDTVYELSMWHIRPRTANQQPRQTFRRAIISVKKISRGIVGTLQVDILDLHKKSIQTLLTISKKMSLNAALAAQHVRLKWFTPTGPPCSMFDQLHAIAPRRLNARRRDAKPRRAAAPQTSGKLQADGTEYAASVRWASVCCFIHLSPCSALLLRWLRDNYRDLHCLRGNWRT